jgi:hypothetical protein
MVEQFAVLRAAMSFTVEWVLGRSSTDAFYIDVVDELVAEFRKQEERCLRLKKSGIRVCDLILGPPSDWVRLAE